MRSQCGRSWKVGLLVCALIFSLAGEGAAGAQYSESSGQKEPPQEGKGVPEAGPGKSVGETVVVPRKRPSQPPQPKEEPVKVDRQEAPIFRTEVELVAVGVVVQDRNGNFIPGLKKENFRILEDGTPQQIQRLETVEAPVTVALVIEFSSLFWDFLYQTINAS